MSLPRGAPVTIAEDDDGLTITVRAIPGLMDALADGMRDRAVVIDPDKPHPTFDDVIGQVDRMQARLNARLLSTEAAIPKP